MSVHHMTGGVRIDENAHLIDRRGKIISGLYAAGEVTNMISWCEPPRRQRYHRQFRFRRIVRKKFNRLNFSA